MSRLLPRLLIALLLVASFVSTLGTVSAAGPDKKPKDPLSNPFLTDFHIGRFQAKHKITYVMWYMHRATLGNALYDEEYIHAIGTKYLTEGSAMGFEHGLVCRIGTGVRAGKVTILRGGIRTKYDQVGGLHGKLGFPTTSAYVWNQATGGFGQEFEGGQILWDEASHQYLVRYFE